MSNLNEILTPIYNKFKINNMDFIYDKPTNTLISKEPVFYPNDIAPYNILIKITGNLGSIITAINDGEKFHDIEFLGQIKFDGKQWHQI